MSETSAHDPTSSPDENRQAGDVSSDPDPDATAKADEDHDDAHEHLAEDDPNRSW